MMTSKSTLINAILCAGLVCGNAALAQEPVQNIDKKVNPNLAEAQRLAAQANTYIMASEKDNKGDAQVHTQKARELLVQVNQELKLAAQEFDAPHPKK